jgi:hypothetical protein
MPDAFLRRVIAQREIEQELGIVATPVAALIPGRCRVCGGYLSMSQAGRTQQTVCSGCGGRKKQRKLEREDLARDSIARFRRSLLHLVYPTTEDRMPRLTDRVCSRPNCKNHLGGKNKTGVCTPCQQSSSAGADGNPKTLRARRAVNVRKRFRALTEALDIDGDKLLEEFMQGYIEKLRDAMPKPEDDAKPASFSADDTD